MKYLPITLLFFISLAASAQDKQAPEVSTPSYVCMPCGAACDDKVYTSPGKCEHCQMELVKSFTIMHKTIAHDEVCAYVKAHPQTVLLDVRTKEEFEAKTEPNYGTLKGAINIPISELQARIGELKAYKNREIIVYCSHSRRSPRASYMLTQMGFGKVYNMSGGMSVMTDASCKK